MLADTLWISPGWAEGFALAAAIVAAALTAIELLRSDHVDGYTRRAQLDALLPLSLCLIALALFAF
jgi:hypothetical protein